jgi:hypothetical protein
MLSTLAPIMLCSHPMIYPCTHARAIETIWGGKKEKKKEKRREKEKKAKEIE